MQTIALDLKFKMMDFFKGPSTTFLMLKCDNKTSRGKIIDELSSDGLDSLASSQYKHILFTGSVNRVYNILNRIVRAANGTIDKFRVFKNKGRVIIQFKATYTVNGVERKIRRLLKSL